MTTSFPATTEEPMAGAPPVAVRAQALEKSFGAARALRGATFEVVRGEVFGLVGPNGAGKTTLLMVLAGLCRPDAGWAEVAGANVATEAARLHRLVGYMPEHFGIYDSMTASEYLTFYASCYRLPRQKIERAVGDLLALVGLVPKRDTTVGGLSRGMRQRLCLARCLVHDPEVLLLDEPASGLDPRARADLLELVAELGEMGKTVVLASQILAELAEVCTSFGILHEGSMASYGTAEELLGPGADLEGLFLCLTETARDQEADEGGSVEDPTGEPRECALQHAGRAQERGDLQEDLKDGNRGEQRWRRP